MLKLLSWDKIRYKMLIYLITGGDLYGRGGSSKYMRELVNYLTNTGLHVKVMLRMGRVISINREKIDIHAINSRKGSSKYKFSSLHFMLSHLPNPLTVVLGILMLIKDVKNECNSRKIMIMHIHDTSSSILVATVCSKILSIPFLVQIHGFPLREQKIKLSKAYPLLRNLVWFLTKVWFIITIRLMKHNAKVILVNNSEIKSFYESSGIPSWMLEIMPSAIDINEFERSLLSTEKSRKLLGISNLRNTVVMGYIGGLRPEKNVETLVAAFASFLKCSNTDVRLVIIGEGPSRQSLEKAVKELNIGNYVLFLGFIPDAYKFLNAIDIFVLPSLSEGSPFSLIEAIAAGKAIIASNIPAIKEIVEDRKEALLFDPHNHQQLKNLILELCYNPKLRKELGERAKRKAKQYDVNIVFQKYFKIYKRILRPTNFN